MNTEGEFNFSNGCLINNSLSQNRKISVAAHEAQHLELYSITTYGELIIMLEKNSLMHPKSKWSYEELFKYMNRMQERIAVNIEYFDILINNGYEMYLNAIESLKCKNKTYYNYFRKLCCINGKVSSKDSAKTAKTILRNIGNMALNCKINEIPFDKMDSPKDLNAFFNLPGNHAKYNPNKRFDIIIDFLFRTTKYQDIIADVLNSTIDDNSLENVNEIAMESAKKVFSGSLFFHMLVQRASSVSKLIYPINCTHPEFLTMLPFDFKNDLECTFEELTNSDFLNMASKKEYLDSLMIIPHQMRGFESIAYLNLYDSNKKINYFTIFYDEELFIDALKQIKQPVVFIQTKLFRKMKPYIKGIVQTLPIYIFTESPIYMSLEFISKNFKKGRYSYYSLNGYIVLVIYRRCYFFLCTIIDLALNELDNFFKCLEISYLPFDEIDGDKDKIKFIAQNCINNMIQSKNFVDTHKSQIQAILQKH